MRGRIPWRHTSRLIAAVGVVGLAVAGSILAVNTPWPTITEEPVSVQATAAPTDTVLACPGPLLALGRDATDATGLSVAAAATVAKSGDDATSSTVSSPASGDTPTVLTAPPAGSAPAELGAAQTTTVRADDLVGLGAAACATPALESWLVGGATTTGSNDLILLSNPSSVPAAVTLTIYGAQGGTIPPGAKLTVAPGAQAVVPLSGLIVDEESPIVQVSATGAAVTAALQTSLTRTLAAIGVDVLTAVDKPRTLVSIPGITVTAAAAKAASDAVSTVVRLMAPDADTAATITMSGPGSAKAKAVTVDLTAGLPAEVQLDGLAAGTHSVTVTADTGVVASVWQSGGPGGGADFAWFGAAPPIDAATAVAVPTGPSPTLSIAVEEGTTVTLEGPGTDSQSWDLQDGQSVTVPVTAGESYRLVPTTGGVHAAVSYSGKGELSGFTVPAAGASADAITIYP